MHNSVRPDPQKVKGEEDLYFWGFPLAISEIESICACLMTGMASHEGASKEGDAAAGATAYNQGGLLNEGLH